MPATNIQTLKKRVAVVCSQQQNLNLYVGLARKDVR